MKQVITIPKNLSKEKDLVVMSRSEYEDYLKLEKVVPIVEINISEEIAIKKGRKEIRSGSYLDLKKLKNGLGC